MRATFLLELDFANPFYRKSFSENKIELLLMIVAVLWNSYTS